MPLDPNAPEWAKQLALAYESGATGVFALAGNVADRFPRQGRLLGLVDYLDAELLSGFPEVFVYDPGNGLAALRSTELFQKWPGAKQLGTDSREPRSAIDLISRYLRYRANLAKLGRDAATPVALLLRGADQVLPAGRHGEFELASLVSLVRDWASESPFTDLPFACFLLADQISDLHPMLAQHPRVNKVRVPLPDVPVIEQALAQFRVDFPAAFAADADPGVAAQLAGVSVSALQAQVKMAAHEKRALQRADWVRAKKRLIESDASDLVEFVESSKSLDQYHAQDALKTWLRQDIQLWHAGDLKAMPMGYIFCGPVGTGKTYLVECLAGEAGVPVLKLKNFRDRWVGSSEGNLEKIFRLIRALGRCIVFIDEADQSLGKRDAGSGDSGLSGRLYSMLAQEMSQTANRGKVLWILASSRPDLIEVDLKRPGRIDVKIPLLPTSTVEESAGLLSALLKRLELNIEPAAMAGLDLPVLLTPGAAEALAVKVYRRVRTNNEAVLDALKASLAGYQPPVPLDVLHHQMRIAIREATDQQFVPAAFRAMAESGDRSA